MWIESKYQKKPDDCVLNGCAGNNYPVKIPILLVMHILKSDIQFKSNA